MENLYGTSSERNELQETVAIPGVLLVNARELDVEDEQTLHISNSLMRTSLSLIAFSLISVSLARPLVREAIQSFKSYFRPVESEEVGEANGQSRLITSS